MKDSNHMLEITSIPTLISKDCKRILFEEFSEDERSSIFLNLSVELALEILNTTVGNYKGVN